MAELLNLKKRKSVTKGSITRLFNHIKTLELKSHEASTLDFANQLIPNLKVFHNQFETQHFSVMDAIDESDVYRLSSEGTRYSRQARS